MIALATLLAAIQAAPAAPAVEVRLPARPTTLPTVALPGVPRATGMPAVRMQPLQQQSAAPQRHATSAPVQTPNPEPSIAQPGGARVTTVPADTINLQGPPKATTPQARTAAPAAAIATLPHPVLSAAPRPAVAVTANWPSGNAPGRDQVLAAVRAEFPSYDTRHQGRLGPLEFGTWVMRANGAAVQAPGSRRDAAGVKPVTAMNATARAFAKADANHDGGVTPEELAAFLTAR